MFRGDTRKVEYVYNFISAPMPYVYSELSKLVHACRNYGLPKLARVLRQIAQSWQSSRPSLYICTECCLVLILQ